ncbi:dynamin family protein [Aliiroseovarius sp. S253]|uniref:dynamin family protein n=1 Tax=Aliiroseovarius sp. S253 TaxID=3415133 RepID=UPI003C7E9083
MTEQDTPRIVTAEQWKRLKRWSHRKPVFALMGEFSAGKSTLLNFLLKKDTLPTQVTATQLPPIWFSWGNKPAYVQNLDGSREHIELDQIGEVGVQGAHFVRVYLEADILEAVDLIDTPGISDPKISADVWQRAVGQANGVLWCTHSTQAWRETERATWASLPERLRKNSLLLVTRSDALSETDQAKVLRRINRETGDMFRRTIMISARDAILARDNEEHAELWAGSGGGKLVNNFLTITSDIMETRATLLARYQKDGADIETDSDALQLGGETSTRVWNPPVLSVADDAKPDAAEDSDRNVVHIRPARPRREDRARETSQRRQRIDAHEADRLRAQVHQDSREDQEAQELKSVFHVSDSTEADLHDDTADSLVLVDDAVDALDDTDVDLFPIDDETEVSETLEDQTDALEDASADEDADHLIASVTELVSDKGEDTVTKHDADEHTALPASEPIPLAENPPVYSMPDTAPLSASDAWTEHLASLEDTSDPVALIEEFQDFLKRFDDRAREHHAQQSESALQSLSDTAADSGTVWHVL